MTGKTGMTWMTGKTRMAGKTRFTGWLGWLFFDQKSEVVKKFKRIEIFPKGLVHSLRTAEAFPVVDSLPPTAGETWNWSRKNRMLLQAISHGFCQKFLSCVFLDESSKQDGLLIFWIEKNAFLTRKVKFWKCPKHQNSPKGLVLCGFFGQI